MNYDNNIFICHYTPLTERKEFMTTQCKKYNIDNKLTFIEKFDRENIPQIYLNIFDHTKLKMCEISLFLKHINAMKKIYDSKYDYGIVMEDDVIFKDNFINNYNDITNKIPDDFDILYVGFFPFLKDWRIRNITNKHPIPDNSKSIGKFKDMKNISVFPWTGNNKGTDFYIISKKCCKLFLDFIKNTIKNNDKINSPIDHFMGQFTYKSNVYWTSEEITIHGSWGEGWNNNAIFKNSMKEQRGY